MSRKRRRYSDTGTVPNGRRTRFEGDWKERHRNRKREANREQRNAGLAFASIGGWLVVKNDGEHWQVWLPKRPSIQWWPSTAKLVIGEVWRQGKHCHRWQDLFRFAKEYLAQ